MVAAPEHRHDSSEDAFPLVGRSREVRRLREQLVAATRGAGSVVLMSGEAGIGKTTLVEVVAREATARGGTVLTGGCYDLTDTPPYGPWRELAARAPVGGTATPLPALLDTSAGTVPGGDRSALFDQVHHWLATIAQPGPLVVALEDLHWSDPATLDLLRHEARRVATLPLLLIATYRGDELNRQHPLSSVLHFLVREAGAERLDLRRFDDQAIAELVSARWTLAASQRDRLVAYLRLHSGGNPLYASELLRTLEDEAVLRPVTNGWTLGDLDTIGVPPLLQQVIDSRIDRLGEETRDLLTVAAILGDDVPITLWAAVAGVSTDAVTIASERATTARILEPSRDETRVTFVHALIRDALYRGSSPRRRRLWNRRAGEALAATSLADPEAIALHYRRAGDPRAPEWLIRAGDHAQRSYAWSTAAERFLAAQALLETDPRQASARGWLLYRAGRLLRFTDPRAGIRLLDDAARVASDHDLPVLLAYAEADRGNLRCLVGDIATGLRELTAGVAAIDALPPDHAPHGSDFASWTADALPTRGNGAASTPATAGPDAFINPRQGTLAIWLASVGRFAEARAIGEPLLARIDALPPGVPLPLLFTGGDVAYALALAAAARGDVPVAREAFLRSREPARSTGHHISVGWMAERELSQVVLPFQTDHIADRERLAIEAEAAMTLAGRDSGPGGMPPRRGALRLLVVTGAWEEAMHVGLVAREVGTHYGRQETIAALAGLAALRGETDLAWRLVDEVLPRGPETEPGGSIFHVATEAQRVAVDLGIATGNLSRAEAWLRAHDRWLAWGDRARGGAAGFVRWAALAHAAGTIDVARQRAEAALAAATTPRQPPRPAGRSPDHGADRDDRGQRRRRQSASGKRPYASRCLRRTV